MPRVQILRSDQQLVTDLDHHPSHYRRFNNSLVHFRDDLYLMTYRRFLPSKTVRRFDSDSRNRHPWSSNWSSKVDDTVVSVLRLQPDHSFRFEGDLPLTYPSSLRRFVGNFQDVRMVRLREPAGHGHVQWYLYGQAWVVNDSPMAVEILRRQPKAAVTECLRHGSDCALVAVLLARVEVAESERHGTRQPTSIHVKDVQLPCLRRPEVYVSRQGDLVEKNWCFFEHKGRIHFEYLLAPHRVYTLDCRKVYEAASPLTALVRDLGCGTFFSPGSPLTVWDRRHWLGCGHVKYKYQCRTLLTATDGKYMHPPDWGGFVYAMFFYLVRRRPPFELVAFSPAFLPWHPHMQYTIVFPMACLPLDDAAANENQTWAISYGEGDDTPNILTLQRSDIRQWLERQPASASDFTVSWMPTN